MGKRILIVASIGQHLIRFHMPTIGWLLSEGHVVHAACASVEELSKKIKVYPISFERRPFSINNIQAFFQLRKVLTENDFDIIHCHTAVASVITRLAARPFRKSKNIKVIYTAHGFHFYKGSPLSYWLLYYPIELFFSRFLDCQITINQEDFVLASKKFYCKDVRKISGMGADMHRFLPLTRDERKTMLKQFSIPEDSKILVYVAEFIQRKNHDFLVEVAIKLKSKFPNLFIILPGRGKLLDVIKNKISSIGMKETIIVPGFRDDIEKIIGFADIGISTSRQEGLGMNIIETMMCGIPVVASNNRGHKEIINHGVNGFLFETDNQAEFISYIDQLLMNEELYANMASKTRSSMARFDLKVSLAELQRIYHNYL